MSYILALLKLLVVMCFFFLTLITNVEFMDCSQGSDGFGTGRGFGRGVGGRMGGRGFGMDLSMINCILLSDMSWLITIFLPSA